jgi:hypothetical protein
LSLLTYVAIVRSLAGCDVERRSMITLGALARHLAAAGM